MTPTKQEIHDKAVSNLVSQYQKNGFTVLIEPSGREVPAFLGNYRPDLIVKNDKKSVIVEVKVGTEVAHGERFRAIAERVAQEPGWEFSLVIISGENSETDSSIAELPTQVQVIERIGHADELLRQGRLDASFLLFWMCLESVLRLLAVKSKIPLRNAPPSAMIRELYSAGELSNEQSEVIMKLMKVRNSLIHGYIISVIPIEIDTLRKTIFDLISELNIA